MRKDDIIVFNLGNAGKNFLVSKNEENKYYDENIVIDIKDKNNTHSIIANHVNDGSVCLDVGCGAGYTGELIKNNKNSIVYGIDIDEEAIEVAKTKNIYQETYNFSITDSNTKEYHDFFDSSLKFDYIIFADVLEHVPNPGEIIHIFSKKLKENGKILVSIPNIAHMDICLNLINRTFNYNKIGILDNTHLRFFTKTSFIEMIDGINDVYNLNLGVKMIGKTIVSPPDVSSYSNLYNILNEDNEFCVLQYVYEIFIEKSSKNKKGTKEYNKKDYCSIIENTIKGFNENNKIIEKQHLEIQILNEKIEELYELNKVIDNEKNRVTNELKDVTNKLDEVTNTLNETTCNLNDTTNRLNERNNDLKDILESKSWKVTKPLRFMSSNIKYVKSKIDKSR